MQYRATLDGTVHAFPSLKALLAKASPARSGDALAGIAAEGPLERIAAQHCLADVPLADFLDDVLEVDGDAVTRLIAEQRDEGAFAPIASHTVGGFRDWLLDPTTTGREI